MVNWNGKFYLKPCLDSIAEQTFKDFELIFIDNNSTDDSVDFVKKNYSFARVVKLKTNKGLLGGNHEGLKYTKGNYIFVTGPEIGETVTANEVYKDTQYIIMSGKITEVNQDDFTVKIVTIDKSDYELDIEKSTKLKLLDIKTFETDSIGFSKLKEGDSVHAVVKGDPENPDITRFNAIKLLIIPNEYFLQ